MPRLARIRIAASTNAASMTARRWAVGSPSTTTGLISCWCRPQRAPRKAGNCFALRCRPCGIIHSVADADPQCLLILAHNPGLHELALGLIASGDPAGRQALANNLPTAGVAVIDFKIDNWEKVGFRTGRLERFASPKLLREGSEGA